jgi:hypothetical protein
MKFFVTICLMLTLLLWGNDSAIAGVLSDRLAQFPDWDSKPPVQVAQGDLVYPDWMAGIWQVNSTLVDMVAPLAPQLVTPGFESNRQYLHQPVSFLVKFGDPTYKSDRFPSNFLPIPAVKPSETKTLVVADRAFNGLNIATAYLGDDAIVSVKVDPENPNRQITGLRGDRQLVSVVTGRLSETVAPDTSHPSLSPLFKGGLRGDKTGRVRGINVLLDQFIATEITQQIFQGKTEIYLNEVETTTRYQVQNSGNILADQITAIYLSPKDPDYFKAAGHPVALYRYELELLPVESPRLE